MSEHPESEPLRPGDDGLPLTFDAWTDLSARLLNLGPGARLGILDEQDVDEPDWLKCNEHYCMVLAQDLAEDRRDKAMSYARKCAAEFERRKRRADAPSEAEAEPPNVSPEPPATVTFGAPWRTAAESTPTFLLPAQAPAPPAARRRNELAATADPFEIPSALKGGALPFHSSSLPSPLAAPSAPMVPLQRAEDTMPLGTTLPFGPGNRPTPPQAPVGGLARAAALDVGVHPVQPSSVASPVPTTPPTPMRMGAETLPVDPTLPPAPALPFGPPAAEVPAVPPFPAMSVQTYASFCAELAVLPDKATEVHARYHVASEAVRTALDHHWQANFTAHPETRATWQQLVDHYREWLQRQARA